MNENEYININKVAEAKGLKSNRSLRLEINKPESKYIAREVKVNFAKVDNTNGLPFQQDVVMHQKEHCR